MSHCVDHQRRLLLLRHAKSDWANPALSDHERPLNDRGMRTAPRMGQHIESMQLPIDHVLCSTARRAQQTLRLMQNVWQRLQPEVAFAQELYLASPKAILQELSQLDERFSSVMIVGHNPGISEMASWLAQDNIEMPTAGLVVFSGGGIAWSSALEGSQWTLEQMCFPRKLGI